ncbi:MAG: Asp-tRNA(Asn)/Glu-tRNA(Gln) amidotransferase subunit GatC [Solitalea-like symbiont of Acarus siro]
MNSNNINITELANLAKLEVKDVEIHIKDLLEILKLAEKLNELDTLQIDPLTSMVNMSDPNKLREDEVIGSISTTEALSNAPSAKGSFFTAPKVVNK